VLGKFCAVEIQASIASSLPSGADLACWTNATYSDRHHAGKTQELSVKIEADHGVEATAGKTDSITSGSATVDVWNPFNLAAPVDGKFFFIAVGPQ
jgi:hypothetical protein